MRRNKRQTVGTPKIALRQCRIIGKGHAGCISLVLKDWWVQEHFTNVILCCKEVGLKRTQLRANASILAAASPFFRTILADYSGLEEDAIVVLPDYTRAAVFYALQYIYTGQVTLKASKLLLDEVQHLLTTFGIAFRTMSLMTVDEKLASYELRAATVRDARNVQTVAEKPTTTLTLSPVPLAPSRAENEPTVTPPVDVPVTTDRNVNAPTRPLILSYSRRLKKPRVSPGDGIDCVQMDRDNVNLNVPLPCETNEMNLEKHTLQTEPLPSEPTQIAASTFVQCLQRDVQLWGPVASVPSSEPPPPFAYDPSPQYLQHVPVKQYGRRSRNQTTGEKIFRMTGNKIHVTNQIVPVRLGKDSLFADAGDCSDVGEHSYASAKDPPPQCRPPEQSPKKLDEAHEEARRLLHEEREKHQKLKRVLKQLEARILKIRKKTTEDSGTKKKKKQEKSDAKICCDKCGKMVTASWMKNHRKTHEEHQHCCDQCGRTFSLRSLFLLHCKRQHRDLIAETGGHPCSVCGEVFKFPKYLKHHMTRHTGEKPYACRYCDRRFRSELVRSNHQRVHTGERPFICDICGKGFAQKATLTAHLRSHERLKLMNGVTSKGRPCFQCQYCSAQFQQEPNYLEHMAKHSGDVPVLPCRSCHRVFTSVKDLKRHEESHLDRVYACEFCRKKFNKRSNYYNHRSKVHRGMMAKRKLDAGRDHEASENSRELLIQS